MKIVTLTSIDLAYSVAKKLGIPADTAHLDYFSDGELHVTLSHPDQYLEQTVIIIQSTAEPVNDLVLSTAFLAHELKNAGATKIIAVIPYFGYSRQEKSTIEPKPGFGKIVAQLLQNAGIDQLIVVELHSSADIISFFDIPVTNIRMIDVIADHIKKTFIATQGICLVAPDEGITLFVEHVAEKLSIDFISFTKQRYAKDKTRIIETKGSVEGHTAIIIDDIISTGGTAIHAAQYAHDHGFTNIFGYFVHPIFAYDAVEIIKEGLFNKIFITNSIPMKNSVPEKIEIIDISDQLAQEIDKVMKEHE